MKYAVAVLLGAASAYENQNHPQYRQEGALAVHNLNEALQKASVAYLDLHTYFEEAIGSAKREQQMDNQWSRVNGAFDSMFRNPEDAMHALEKVKQEMTHGGNVAPMEAHVHALAREQYWLEFNNREKLE
jgi:hypothetical protein